jgi:hypothetical protein
MYSSWFAGLLILFGGRWWEAGDALFDRRDVGVIDGEPGLQNDEGLLEKRAGLLKPPRACTARATLLRPVA